MNRIIIGIAALSVATLFQPSTVEAQERWSIEIRGNGAISTQDAARETHQNGVGIEGNVQYRFLPHLAAYAGWDYTVFGALEAIAGPDLDVEETGYVVGLRFEHPFREGGRTNGWVRSGLTYNHLELENDAGDLIADSGHGFGWEFGAGLALPVRGRWSVTPGIRYRSISRDLEIGDTSVPVELQYVAFELGLGLRF